MRLSGRGAEKATKVEVEKLVKALRGARRMMLKYSSNLSLGRYEMDACVDRIDRVLASFPLRRKSGKGGRR